MTKQVMDKDKTSHGQRQYKSWTKTKQVMEKDKTSHGKRRNKLYTKTWFESLVSGDRCPLTVG